jgi:hypothetical protein
MGRTGTLPALLKSPRRKAFPTDIEAPVAGPGRRVRLPGVFKRFLGVVLGISTRARGRTRFRDLIRDRPSRVRQRCGRTVLPGSRCAGYGVPCRQADSWMRCMRSASTPVASVTTASWLPWNAQSEKTSRCTELRLIAVPRPDRRSDLPHARVRPTGATGSRARAFRSPRRSGDAR